MKWKSFRPAAMLIEKSFDYGRSWNVSRYYAKSCQLSFPGVPTRPTRDISIPYCTPKYSKLEPSTGGEVWKCLCSFNDTLTLFCSSSCSFIFHCPMTYSCRILSFCVSRSSCLYSYLKVVYKALRGNENAADVKTQNLLRVTNLRITFTKLNTLGDDIIDNRFDIQTHS